jgi:uncharacterized protein (TIGR02600 family)
MAIAPRLTYQNNNTNVGSQWGSYVTENSPSGATFGTLILVNPGIDQAFRIPDDAARLYANVDELLFATNRSSTGTNPVITAQLIEQSRFFLTASSRAPDVTLFNTPRIVSWPITYAGGITTKITPYDRLIAFCGTVGANTNYASDNSYYFTRFYPLSATADYSANTRLLAYLRRMTTSAVPGFGGSGILGKYGPGEAEQITTQIFDYIRCINVRDMSMAASATNTTNPYVYASGHAGVMPSQGNNNTRGFGRFPTITKVGIVFWFNNYFRTIVTNSFTNAGVVNTQINTNTNVSLCARLIMEPFYASHGHPSPVTSQTHRIRVDGLMNLQWGVTTNTNILTTNSVTGLVSTNNTNLFLWTNIFPNNTAMFTNASQGRPHGGRVAFESITTSGFIGTSPTNTNPAITNLPLVGPATRFFNTDTTRVVTNAVNTNQTVAYTNSTFGFSGGTLTFTITDNAGANTHQEIIVYMPPTYSLPVPLDTYTTNWVATGTVPQTKVSFNGPGAWTSGNFAWTHALDVIDYTNSSMWRSATNIGRTIQESNHRFRPEDVVRAVAVEHGDFRLISANPSVGTNSFSPIGYNPNNVFENFYFSSNSHQRLAHNFVGEYPYSTIGGRFPHANYYISTNTTFTAGLTNSVTSEFGPLLNTNSTAPINWTTNGLYTRINGDSARPTTTAVTGDFDNGYGAAGDGPYIGFADEGNARVFQFRYTANGSVNFSVPYLDGSGQLLPVGAGFFSPNRLVPSAGIMGSLPTGVISQTPWQTLLFRPAALTSATHPGLNNPPDYLLLDLFNMPVVEPYAISEPLSTAGRVNMNYQILPFTYIKRSTAVQAALHTEWLTAIPNGRMSDQGRKSGGPGTSAPSRDARNSRWPLNLNTNTGTLRGFEDRFAGNDIFRSAAEICSIPLVPTNSTWSAVTGGSFWPNYSLTGDNSKERPYARIYPKLTTKSNTYTVHYRVEVLKKSPNSTSQNTWADGTDKIISTYRGSTTIERYVNPRDQIPDYADPSLTPFPPTGTNALPNFYKFRILAERQFNP